LSIRKRQAPKLRTNHGREVGIRLKKTKLVTAGFFLCLGGLWIAGPQRLDTGCYVQCVSATAATIAKVDAAQRALWFRLFDGAGDMVAERASTARELHAVEFAGLQPATRYTYTCTVQLESATAGEAIGGGSFRTAPIDDAATVRFAAVGDSGDVPWWYNMHDQGWSRIRPLLAFSQRTKQWDVAEWIAAQHPDFFVHLGDIVYWRQIWDAHGEAFFRPFEPVLRQTPIFMLPGNHDLPPDGSEAPFERIFRNPQDAAARAVGRPQRNFTAAFGSVRLIGYDLTDPECLGPERLAWLAATLLLATEPWLVVAMHRPCFSVYRQEDPALLATLWPVLHAHGVDLVMSGDDHHYARFARMPDAAISPMQLIAGAGGKKLYVFDEQDPRLQAGRSAWSFLLIEAQGLVLRGRALGEGGVEYDAWTIDRRTGDLPANIGAGRRARILKARR
jgi:hypothetical protein